jgi:hypothetical protein
MPTASYCSLLLTFLTPTSRRLNSLPTGHAHIDGAVETEAMIGKASPLVVVGLSTGRVLVGAAPASDAAAWNSLSLLTGDVDEDEGRASGGGVPGGCGASISAHGAITAIGSGDITDNGVADLVVGCADGTVHVFAARVEPWRVRSGRSTRRSPSRRHLGGRHGSSPLGSDRCAICHFATGHSFFMDMRRCPN